jgi:hypothetical protein
MKSSNPKGIRRIVEPNWSTAKYAEDGTACCWVVDTRSGFFENKSFLHEPSVNDIVTRSQDLSIDGTRNRE